MQRYLVLSSLLSLALSSPALAIVPSITEIKDSRTTGQFFNECTIEITLVGDELADAYAIRTTVDAAIDDTGRDLRNLEKLSGAFEELSNFNRGKVSLKLKNPARKAATIKDLSGRVDVYSVKADPASAVEIKSAIAQSGKALSAPALAQNQIEITIYTAADYAAKRQAEMASNPLTAGLRPMWGSGGESGDVTFVIKDPKKRLVGYRFVDASGKPLETRGTMTINDIKTVSYGVAVPPDASLMIYVASDKAITSVPFSFSGVALP